MSSLRRLVGKGMGSMLSGAASHRFPAIPLTSVGMTWEASSHFNGELML